ncbi:MAG: efflux RND transporter periplasmic adaptor subunit [Saprospiraceae bacterium]|jgi:membrane fusion protein (multidrug efflux system)|nr:MAG: RND family efflux transporter MFP subunit [Candidatus Parvibacillus calidus]MBX2936302.1 efflux RND transporter periplasmic adaptor subunit [Saprospiraceae bacterium]MBK7739112.1 efflux RND transporter periplasmic adaptor subunit [Candidatus Parvibacillus calidus]MBX7179577.1 efflux RND transporter periplasmic adaptor subunit [Saprospiraceae bacterium]MCB0589670.1 efflux RND transporter periplasmic adaptor subunit [Saprospiraceae bacterium]
MRKYIVLITITAIVAALFVAKFLFFPAQEEQKMGFMAGGKKSGPLGVDIQVLKSEKANGTLQSTGTILANEKVDLSPEAAGKVSGIYFKEGGLVKAGQLLVKLNDADLKAQINKSRLNLKLAEDKAARQEKLLAIQGTSKEDYDIAHNEVLSFKADIAYYQTLIDKTELRAPFSGIVGFRNIALGSYVSPSVVVTTLQQLDPIKIEFTAPEKYLANFKVGQKFNFYSEASKKTLTGTVQTIDPQIDLNTRSVIIRGVAPNVANLLPGNFVKVDINISQESDVLRIPSSAVVPILKGQKVYLYKNGKVVEKKIEILGRDDKTVQVSNGLNAGDSLIITGIIMLKEDMDVKPDKVK